MIAIWRRLKVDNRTVVIDQPESPHDPRFDTLIDVGCEVCRGPSPVRPLNVAASAWNGQLLDAFSTMMVQESRGAEPHKACQLPCGLDSECDKPLSICRDKPWCTHVVVNPALVSARWRRV